DVLVEQADCDVAQRAVDRGNLLEDVDAVDVLVDHPLQAADLALDAAQPSEVLLLGHGVPAHARPRWSSIAAGCILYRGMPSVPHGVTSWCVRSRRRRRGRR